MKCKECNYEFDNAKFCPECGKPVPIGNNKIKCIKCGHEVDSNIKFCPECGESVHSDYNDKDKKGVDKKYRDRRNRDRRGDDDDEGGILGGIGDIVGKIFG